MPLNLGNLINEITVSDTSIDEAYAEWLEANQKYTDLTNALEIVELAVSSQSSECIKFAEELLGCSCEVLKDKEREKSRVANNLIHRSNLLLSLLHNKVNTILNTCKDDKTASDLLKNKKTLGYNGESCSIFNVLTRAAANLSKFTRKTDKNIDKNTILSKSWYFRDYRTDKIATQLEKDEPRLFDQKGRNELAHFLKTTRRVVNEATRIFKQNSIKNPYTHRVF